MSKLVFCCCSLNINIAFLKQLFQISFKLRPIIKLEYQWLFKQTILSVLCFQYKCNLTCLIRLKSPTRALLKPCRLMQHQHLLTFTCMCSLQRHEAHKTDQTDAAHEVLSPCNGDTSYPKGVVHELPKVLVFLTMA